MFKLKRLNVVKLVTDEAQRDRLVNAGFTLVGEVTPDFDSMTVKELQAYAEGKGIDLTGLVKKEDILAAVKSAVTPAKKPEEAPAK